MREGVSRPPWISRNLKLQNLDRLPSVYVSDIGKSESLLEEGKFLFDCYRLWNLDPLVRNVMFTQVALFKPHAYLDSYKCPETLIRTFSEFSKSPTVAFYRNARLLCASEDVNS